VGLVASRVLEVHRSFQLTGDSGMSCPYHIIKGIFFDRDDASDPSNGPSYSYLETGTMTLELENSLPAPIVIKKINLSFDEGNFEEVDSGNIDLKDFDRKSFYETLPEKGIDKSCLVRIEPGKTSQPLNVDFKVNISFRKGSNICKVKITYAIIEEEGPSQNQKRECIDEGRRYKFVQNISMRDKTCFLSHKIKEDTVLALRIKEVLERIGIKSYLAEEKLPPGRDDLWDDLLEGIEKCDAMITIWTGNVEKNRKSKMNIGREVLHAFGKDKVVYPFLARGIQSKRFDKLFPQNRYQHRKFDPKMPFEDICQLVSSIQKDIEDGNIK